jgi:hypothetical protein
LSEDEQIEGTKNAFLTTGDVQVRKKTFYTLGTFGNKGIIAINELMLATVDRLIWDLGISKNELISFKIAVSEAAETYGFPGSTAALDVISLIKDHNKKGQLKKELSELTLQKYAIDRFFSNRSQVIMALMNLKSHGITEDRILQLNNLLENSGYKDMISKSLID